MEILRGISLDKFSFYKHFSAMLGIMGYVMYVTNIPNTSVLSVCMTSLFTKLSCMLSVSVMHIYSIVLSDRP